VGVDSPSGKSQGAIGVPLDRIGWAASSLLLPHLSVHNPPEIVTGIIEEK